MFLTVHIMHIYTNVHISSYFCVFGYNAGFWLFLLALCNSVKPIKHTAFSEGKTLQKQQRITFSLVVIAVEAEHQPFERHSLKHPEMKN